MLRKIDPAGNVKEAVCRHEAQCRRQIAAVLCAAAVLAAAAAVFSGSQVLREGGMLLRNAAGEGSYMVTLTALLQGRLFTEEITVAEQALSGEAVEELFAAAAEELETQMLGENESTDKIVYDLELPAETADGMVSAQWTFDNYQILNADGSIRDDVPEEGTVVEVTLTMTYLEETAQSVFSILVFPRAVSEEEALREALEDAVAQADESTADKENLILPEEVNGEAVVWSEQNEYTVFKILLLGILAALLFRYEAQEKLRRAVSRRDAQMLADYADIVSKLSLLLGAGMTVYGAWEKIVQTYAAQRAGQSSEKGSGRQRAAGGRRIAYEEMMITCVQLQEGAGEVRAYEEFGKRCGLRPYLKLSAILTQNVRLGTAGVTQQLIQEAQDAFEERKALARQKGEEAGTKLLLPMMMLLGVVLAIVAVPGFMSF